MVKLAAYRAAVPPSFQFLAKGHEACTVARWPDHYRYGVHRGQANPSFSGRRYAPFNRHAAPDTVSRQAVADLARAAVAAGRPFLCTINNNAEGCAPLSAVELAREIVGLSGAEE